MLEVLTVRSVAGDLTPTYPLIGRLPFLAPHHSTSLSSLVGGGAGLARPGAVSRAHHGILLLDEACEFGPKMLETLRTALEEGETGCRGGTGRCVPGRCQPVLATNPCPCAPARYVDCQCPPQVRRRFLGRLSGPLVDRMDLRVRVRPITAMTATEVPESIDVVRTQVAQARAAAVRRWSEYGWQANVEVAGPLLRREFALPAHANELLNYGLETGVVMAWGADRCLRIAWTLADLDGHTAPGTEHVAGALEFRDRTAV